MAVVIEFPKACSARPAYYNEIDPHAAQWLRNLIAEGHIAYGHVDERSIEDVESKDLRPYGQCHFFAGIGVWSYALRLAGVSDETEVWTGSCPCQPFSAAGKGDGFDDERHLWPHFYRLIRECRPAAVFGEQVASKAVDAWIDLVLADLEAVDYAGGAIAFPSAGVGAPHIRDRTYWLGYANDKGLEGHARHDGEARWEGSRGSVATAGVSGGVVDPDGREQRQAGQAQPSRQHRLLAQGGSALREECSRTRIAPVDSDGAGPTNGFWRYADWLACRDGKWRPVEPGTFPLAHGVAGRMGRLRAYGNAINAYQAAEFIKAALEVRP